MRPTMTALALGAALPLLATACGAGIEARPTAAPAATTAPADEAAPPATGPTPTPTTAASVGGEDAETVAVLDDTVERTGAVESARYEVLITYDTAAVGAEAVSPLRAAGEFTDGGRSLHLEMDLGAPLGSIEETVVDGVAYVEVPGSGCQSLDMGELFDSFGGGGAGAMDPSAILEQLRAVDGEVTEVGTLDVRGVPTTHLSAHYTMRDALSALSEEQALALEQMSAGLPPSYLDAEQAVDVFIDDDGLMRRMQVESASTEVQGVSLPPTTTILDYFDFGADVTVEAPADCTAVSSSPFGAAGDRPS